MLKLSACLLKNAGFPGDGSVDDRHNGHVALLYSQLGVMSGTESGQRTANNTGLTLSRYELGSVCGNRREFNDTLW